MSPSLRLPQGALKAVWLAMIAAAFLVAQTVRSEAFGTPESFADLADKVSPAVVNITTSTVIEAPMGPGPMVPEGSPFEDFFRDFNDQFQNGPEQESQRSNALGSGFVISADGYIVTNNHVIEGADQIEIEFFSGDRLDAKLVGTDPKTDIALLKVESDEPLAFVTFGDSDLMRVGDWVMAMGNPLGQGFSVSAGIVSARNRELSGTYDDFLQTDAAINRGNSGGPLFNLDGEVVGVNTAILSPNGGSIGIGFSMASNVVTKVVAQLREFGETRRGWLGVRIQDVTPDVAEAMGLADARGALVTDVPEGPAMEAGVRAGDVIVSFDGVEVKDTRDLVRRVADADVGKAVDLVVLRDGRQETLSLTLGRREEAEGEAVPAVATPDQPVEKDLLGMKLAILDEEMRNQLGAPEGTTGLVVTDINQASEAFEKGLRAGDLITEAGQQKIASIADFEARIEEAKEAGRKSLLLLIRREGNPRFVALSVE
jgi:serine protease Do